MDAYDELNQLASLLSETVWALHQIQKEIVKQNLERAAYSGKPTGVLGLEKTLFIEEEFVKKLREVADISERRFLEGEEEAHKHRPISKIEKRELEDIIIFLKQVKALVPDIDKVRSLPEKQQLQEVGNRLREMTNIAKEFYELQKRKEQLIRLIEEEEISPLLRNVYLSPQTLKGTESLYIYRVTPRQLQVIQRETEKINQCQDPNYKIEWRRWWRDVQVPEIDRNTPLKDPHINVTIKLFGGLKKDIHLLLKEAA